MKTSAFLTADEATVTSVAGPTSIPLLQVRIASKSCGQQTSPNGPTSDSRGEPETPPAGKGQKAHVEIQVPLEKVPSELHGTALLRKARLISIDMRVMFSHDCDYIHPSTGEVRTMALERCAFHGESSRRVITVPPIPIGAATVASRRDQKMAMAIAERAKRMAWDAAQEPDDMAHDDWAGPGGEDALEVLLAGTGQEKLAVALERLNAEMLAMLKEEPLVVRPSAPAKVFGDLHGQFRDMLLYLHHYGFPSMTGPNYVFNGDWVDRGKHQIETVTLVFALKLAFPEKVFLVRGNHEDGAVNKHMGNGGFHYVLRKRFGRSLGANLFRTFGKTFEWLSLAALIDARLLVVHGGIGTGRWKLKELEEVNRPITHKGMQGNNVVYNILWSDPIDEDRGGSFGVHDSPRDHHSGAVHQFGKDVTERFCESNSIAMVIRSHQSERKGAGYEIMHGGLLVTVFSARDYEGNKNDGAILSVEVYGGEWNNALPMLVVRPQQVWSHLKKKHETLEY